MVGFGKLWGWAWVTLGKFKILQLLGIAYQSADAIASFCSKPIPQAWSLHSFATEVWLLTVLPLLVALEKVLSEPAWGPLKLLVKVSWLLWEPLFIYTCMLQGKQTQPLHCPVCLSFRAHWRCQCVV